VGTVGSPYRVYLLPRLLERFYEPRWGRRPRREDKWYFGALELDPLTEDDVELRELVLNVPVAEANLLTSRKFKHRKRDAAYASLLVRRPEEDLECIPVSVRIPWPKDVPAPREITLVPGALTDHRRFCFTVPNPPKTRHLSEKALVTAALFRTLALREGLNSPLPISR